jgi:hypothetical protein
MIDAATRQQLPTGDGQDVAHEVVRVLSTAADTSILIADIESRVASGEKKYGTRLKTNNGRNVDLDLYQEILDAMNYSMQAFLQTGDREYLHIFNVQVTMALRVKTILVTQDTAAARAAAALPVNIVA